MATVKEILCLLGHQPTIAEVGGILPRAWTKNWDIAATKMLNKKWRIKCLEKVGLTFNHYTDDTALARALDVTETRERLIEAVLAQKVIFDGEQKNNPQAPQPVQPRPVIPAIPTFASLIRRTASLTRKADEEKKRTASLTRKANEEQEIVAVIQQIAKVSRKLHNKLLNNFRAKVDQAKERKSEWLRPLMWEALGNIQLENNSQRLKRDFYKKAKDTACFDCGIQKEQAKMTYDHLRDKHFNLGSANFGTLHWRRLHLEIGKCDVVCRSCHDIREYLRGRWSWERIGPAEQHRISNMCFMEREVYFQVITREAENPPAIDGESLRKVREIISKILPQEPQEPLTST